MKPNFPWRYFHRGLALALALLIGGAPEGFAQATQSSQSSSQSQQSQQSATPQQQQQKQPSTLDVDPSKGPLQPVPSAQPDQQTTNPPAAPQPQQTAPAQTQQQAAPAPAPQGVAVAGEAKTSGGPASKPAGQAIAPAKQRQTRSLLLKVGAIGAGAAALGIIYGLTRSTSSRPPNAAATTGVAH